MIEHCSSNTVLDLFKCISAVFSCPSVRWNFYLDELRTETMMHCLNLSLLEKCTGFSFMKGSLSTSLLTELMDKIPVSKRLEIGSDIPIDFKHPNVSFYCIVIPVEIVAPLRETAHIPILSHPWIIIRIYETSNVFRP